MWVCGQCHAPLAFSSWKEAVPIVHEVGWAPGAVWTGAVNLAPTEIRSAESNIRSFENVPLITLLSVWAQILHHWIRKQYLLLKDEYQPLTLRGMKPRRDTAVSAWKYYVGVRFFQKVIMIRSRYLGWRVCAAPTGTTLAKKKVSCPGHTTIACRGSRSRAPLILGLGAR